MKSAVKSPHYAGQIQHYAIGPDLPAYIADRYGAGWTLAMDRQISRHGEPLLMDDFRPGVGCCSITALTYVLDFHQRKNPQIVFPGTIESLFTTIEREAAHHGYSLSRGRMNPLRIGSVVRAVWRNLGYTAHSRSILLVGRKVLMDEIDQDRPLLMNIAFGYYRRHTVTLVGYQVWQKKIGSKIRERVFLKVLDGWTRAERFIDLAAIRNPFSGDYSPFSLFLVAVEQKDQKPQH